MQKIQLNTLLFGTCFCLLCSLFLAANGLAGEKEAQPMATGKQGIYPMFIGKDTNWSGEVAVKGETTVNEGVTLTIAPGTTVRFADGAVLYVHGNIKAIGEPDKRITFTALNAQKPGAWKMVELQSSAVGEFSNCIVESAEWGLHSDFSTMKVSNCLLRDNVGGMKFMSGLVEVTNCVFENNKIGIRWRKANGRLENNLITKNDIGTFIKEGGGNFIITNNNIVDNKEYNMRVGDFVKTDVNAPGNWWGPGNPADTIYDGRKEPALGKVIFEPFQKEPVKTAAVASAFAPVVPATIPGIANVDAKDVKEALAKGAHVYDVRPERAVKKGTIPDTENLVYHSKSKKAADFDASKDSFDVSRLPQDKDSELVFYCNGTTCWRSYKAALAAQKAGYKNIKWFRGGIPEWKQAGEPLK